MNKQLFLIGTFSLFGTALFAFASPDNKIVVAYDESGANIYDTISIDLPHSDVKLQTNEFFANTTKDEELALAAKHSGIFRKTKEDKRTGFPVWTY